MLTVRSSVGLIVIFLFVAGCDGVQPELTLEEAEALFAGVMSKSDFLDRMPDTVVVGCLGGGEWEVAGTASRWESGDTFERAVNLVIRPRACIIRSEGRRFTVDGAPELRVDRKVTLVDGNLTEFTGAVSGDIGWLVDQRQGDCAMDLALEVEIGESGVDGTLTGVLCGHDVRLDASPVLDLSFW